MNFIDKNHNNKVFGLLLAAGESTRMGTEKQLLTVAGRSFINRAIDGFLVSGADPIIIVLGHSFEKILEHIMTSDFGMPRADFEKRVIIARNEEYKKGQLSSIKCGLSLFLNKNQIDFFRGFMIQLIDRPMVGPRTFTTILQSFASDGAQILIPSFKNRRGHPACFSAGLIEEIVCLGEDATLRDIINRHEKDVRHIAVDDPGIIQNIDTPEEYDKIKGA